MLLQSVRQENVPKREILTCFLDCFGLAFYQHLKLWLKVQICLPQAAQPSLRAEDFASGPRHLPPCLLLALFLHGAEPEGSLEAEVGESISSVPWAVFSEQRRGCEPEPSAKTLTRFLLPACCWGTQASKHGTRVVGDSSRAEDTSLGISLICSSFQWHSCLL